MTWIRCREQMPDDDGGIGSGFLLFVIPVANDYERGNPAHNLIWFGYYRRGIWVEQGESLEFRPDQVSHWMMAPLPPEEILLPEVETKR